jgi:hypothetical protein
VRALTTFHAEWATAARVANYELSGLTDAHRLEVSGLREGIEDCIERALRRGVDEGSFAPQDVHATTFAILSMAIGVSRWFRADGRLSPEELGQLYADLAIGMVEGVELHNRC